MQNALYTHIFTIFRKTKHSSQCITDALWGVLILSAHGIRTAGGCTALHGLEVDADAALQSELALV